MLTLTALCLSTTAIDVQVPLSKGEQGLNSTRDAPMSSSPSDTCPSGSKGCLTCVMDQVHQGGCSLQPWMTHSTFSPSQGKWPCQLGPSPTHPTKCHSKRHLASSQRTTSSACSCCVAPHSQTPRISDPALDRVHDVPRSRQGPSASPRLLSDHTPHPSARLCSVQGGYTKPIRILYASENGKPTKLETVHNRNICRTLTTQIKGRQGHVAIRIRKPRHANSERTPDDQQPHK